MKANETENEKQRINQYLSDIENRLEDAEKTELTEEELRGLNLKTERYDPSATKSPRASGSRDIINKSYAIYRYDSASLAVETQDNLAGEKRSRRYAIGVGQITFEPLGLDAEVLAEGLETRLQDDEYDADAIDEAVSEWEWGERETCDVLIGEQKGLLYDGEHVYASVRDTNALYTPVVDALGIEVAGARDVARTIISEAAHVSNPDHLDAAGADVGAEVRFE